MNTQVALLVLMALAITETLSFRISGIRSVSLRSKSGTSLYMGVGKEAKRAWAKEDLGGKDMFDDDDDDMKKDKIKLEPETVFFEGPPSISEVFLPALSIVTVIGIIPFISSLSRQLWVRYKFTSRRIGIQSGIGGENLSEIIYPDIDEVKFVYRLGGAGDMVLFLKDGAKVELRHVPKFDETLEYIFTKVDEECRTKSQKPINKKKDVESATA